MIFPTSGLSSSMSCPLSLGGLTVQSSMKLFASAVDHSNSLFYPKTGSLLTRIVGISKAEVMFEQLRGPAVFPLGFSMHPAPMVHVSGLAVPVAPSSGYNELQLYTGPGLCEFEWLQKVVVKAAHSCSSGSRLSEFASACSSKASSGGVTMSVYGPAFSVPVPTSALG